MHARADATAPTECAVAHRAGVAAGFREPFWLKFVWFWEVVLVQVN